MGCGETPVRTTLRIDATIGYKEKDMKKFKNFWKTTPQNVLAVHNFYLN